jgi:hypothetical protein
MEMLGWTGRIYYSERRATAPTRPSPLDLIRELPEEWTTILRATSAVGTLAKSLKSLCCQRWSVGGLAAYLIRAPAAICGLLRAIH